VGQSGHIRRFALDDQEKEVTAPLPRIDWSGNTAQAEWVAERLRESGDVGIESIVPRGFESYARILHPAWNGRLPVRWREVAALTGRVINPLTDFTDIARSADGKVAWTGRDPWSSLSHDDVTALTDIAGEATATPDRCWFCVWDGYGWLYESEDLLSPAAIIKGVARGARREQRPVRSALIPPDALGYPRVHGSYGRTYLLYQGPISAAATFFIESRSWQTPNLWWPADRKWCVATEIDLYSTYIGGSRQLIAAVLADQRLEALPAQAGGPIAG